MFIRYAREVEEDLIRAGHKPHPWDKATYNENFKYYDFVKNPELIPISLEDFRPYNNFAIETFYSLLLWLNGKDSVFESNDCSFEVRGSSIGGKEARLEAFGRLMFHLRDHIKNLDMPYHDQISETLCKSIEEQDKDFKMAHIGYANSPTVFKNLSDPYNKTVVPTFVLVYSVWGKTDSEVFVNLERTYKNLLEALKLTSKRVESGELE